jgi:hypothetical protein
MSEKNQRNYGKIAVTKGKEYIILKINLEENNFAIVDDLSQYHWFQIDESKGKKTYLYSFKEYRKQKLKKLNETSL